MSEVPLQGPTTCRGSNVTPSPLQGKVPHNPLCVLVGWAHRFQPSKNAGVSWRAPGRGHTRRSRRSPPTYAPPAHQARKGGVRTPCAAVTRESFVRQLLHLHPQARSPDHSWEGEPRGRVPGTLPSVASPIGARHEGSCAALYRRPITESSA